MTSIESITLEADDPAAAERFYIDRGLAVTRSFARSYVEFDAPSDRIKLALYKRRALAKDVGVSPDGSGSHRIVIGSDAGAVTDPDGFAWDAAEASNGRNTGLATLASPTPQTT